MNSVEQKPVRDAMQFADVSELDLRTWEEAFIDSCQVLSKIDEQIRIAQICFNQSMMIDYAW